MRSIRSGLVRGDASVLVRLLLCVLVLGVSVAVAACGGEDESGPDSGPPVLQRQPDDGEVTRGQRALLRVSATGQRPMTVQWERSLDGSDWAPVDDSDDTDWVSGPILDDQVQFRAVVTNARGRAVSSAATVTARDEAVRHDARPWLLTSSVAGEGDTALSRDVFTAVAVADDGWIAYGGTVQRAVFGVGSEREEVVDGDGASVAFVAFHRPDGVLERVVPLPGDEDGGEVSVAGVVAHGGGWYVGGTFRGSMGLGIDLWVDIGQQTPFVASFSRDGELQWFRQGRATTDSSYGVVNGLDALPGGGVAVAGTFRQGQTWGMAPAEPVTLSNAEADAAFVVRFAANGTLEWARGATGLAASGFNGVTGLDDGGLLTWGQLSGTVSFGSSEVVPDLGELPGNRGLIVRWSRDGGAAGTATVGGEVATTISSVAVAGSGSITAAVGVFGGSEGPRFGTGSGILQPNRYRGGVLVGYNAQLQPQWLLTKSSSTGGGGTVVAFGDGTFGWACSTNAAVTTVRDARDETLWEHEAGGETAAFLRVSAGGELLEPLGGRASSDGGYLFVYGAALGGEGTVALVGEYSGGGNALADSEGLITLATVDPLESRGFVMPLDATTGTGILRDLTQGSVSPSGRTFLTVRAAGQGPLRFIWQQRSSADEPWSDVGGQSGPQLELTGVDESFEGRRYRVFVGSDSGWAGSREVVLQR